MFYLEVKEAFALQTSPVSLADVEVDLLPFVFPTWLNDGEVVLVAFLATEVPIALLAILNE